MVKEEPARVGDGTGGASQRDELRKEGSTATITGKDESGMDLLQRFETRACLKKRLVSWRVILFVFHENENLP